MDEETWRALAERQHGVVAGWQISDRSRPAERCRGGHWQLVTPTVLRRRGSPLTPEQRVMGAVLDSGPGAVASHATAAALWQLPGFTLDAIEVTRGGRRSSRTPPVARLHRPVLLLPHHRTEVRGIPVTTLARTIFDLAGTGMHGDRMARLVNLVCNRSPGTLVALHRTLEELACRGRPGIQLMREILQDRPVGTVLPASGLEMRFEQLLREAGMKPLRRQVDLGGHEWIGRVDFYDDDFHIVFEVDSILHHTSPMDRARDEARDVALVAAGCRAVVRVPEEHIWYQPRLAVQAVYAARREARANSVR